MQAYAQRGGPGRAACIILSLILLLCLSPAAGVAEGGAGRRTVRVAFPVQSGMSEVGESGDLMGYNYQYMLNLAEYAGWDVEFVTYDGLSANDGIMKAMEQVLSGQVDLLGPMLRSEAVEEMFEFPESNYGIVYTTLCALEKSSLSSVNYTHLKPLRIAVYTKATTRNQEVESYLSQMGIHYQLVQCASTGEQLSALTEGKADLLSSITLSYFEGTRAVAQFAPRPYYFVSTKGNTELMAEMDQAIEKLNYTRPGFQEALQKSYFGDTSGGYVLSDDEQGYIDALQSIDVLCVTNYAPYCLRARDGQPKGVLVSLLNKFAQDNGIQIHYSFCGDAAALEQEWKTGRYDCVIGLPFTPQYCVQHGLIRTATVLTTNMEIYGKSHTLPYSESTVAVYGEFTDQMNLDMFAQVLPFASLSDCFEAVNTGKADYGCTNQISADYEIFENGYAFTATPLLGQQISIGVAVSTGMDGRFLSALNKFIITLPENTVTAFLSEATRHEDIDSFELFLRSQPLTAALLLSVAGVVIVVIVTLVFISSRRKKWNSELQRANAAMQKANAAKSEFLSRMSHDIRTPMNAILGFAELGKQDAASPELLQEDLDKIRSSGEFLLGLVNDVLDISKIESRAVELKPQPYPRAEFEQQLQTLVSPLCAAKHISFELALAEDMPACVRVDKLRMNQIFFNLLSNAVKFTPERGHIRVGGRCAPAGGSLMQMTFTVQDDGIGMSEEFQSKMFDSFTQEEQHISNTQGTGLGLSIVKSLVDLMGGSIAVESQLGKGTVFTLSLTLESCQLPKETGAAAPGGYQASLAGKSVLLVEDHPVNRQLACRLLEKVGIKVACAANGQEGVDQFAASAAGSFSAVLMDIRMPVMDGQEATRAIRAMDRPDAKTVPIIAMTANAFDEDAEKCLAAGMTAHLSKPFNTDRLYETLANETAACQK